MRKGILLGLCVGLLLLGLGGFESAAEEAGQARPSTYFPEPVYTFDPVFEGVEIPHGFTIQNKGTADLEVKRVEGG